MTQKREVMMARESAADSMQALNTLDIYTQGNGHQLSKTFDRWEEQITLQESVLCSNYDEPLDEFEQSFVSDEEQASLLKELNQLIHDEK